MHHQRREYAEQAEQRGQPDALQPLDRRRGELAAARLRPARRTALEPDLPQVALDDAGDLELAARRERELARRDRRLVVAVGWTAPHVAHRVLAPDRTGPRVADRIARLEVVLRRRRRAVLDALLRPLLAAAGHRRGDAEPQV